MIRALTRAFAVLALAVFCAPIAQAQTVADNQLSLSLAPASPGPNETVVLTAASFSANLASAVIVWTVDGTVALEGVGRTSLQITTKKLGQATRVSVSVAPQGGTALQKGVVIVPASVDILWQAIDSVTPPFYRGKAMPLSESSISFVAVPQTASSSGALFAPASLVYDWEENYEADQANSGYGKTSYRADMDYLNPAKNVSVSVSDRTGLPLAAGTVRVVPRSPKLLLYAASPLYGPLYDRALSGSYAVTQSDVALLAQPFFSSVKNTFTWSLNGEDLGPQSSVNVLPLHRETADAGDAAVAVRTKSFSRLFQDSKASLTLKLQ